MKDNDIPMIPRSFLKERGWTEKLIEKFAGQPVKIYIHSMYKTMVKLYSIDYITEIEKSDAFIDAKNKTQKYKESTKNAMPHFYIYEKIFSLVKDDNVKLFYQLVIEEFGEEIWDFKHDGFYLLNLLTKIFNRIPEELLGKYLFSKNEFVRELVAKRIKNL